MNNVNTHNSERTAKTDKYKSITGELVNSYKLKQGIQSSAKVWQCNISTVIILEQ